MNIVDDILDHESCQCILHDCNVFNKAGNMINGHDVVHKKVVGFYFTSNWCEPCHTFTTTLYQAYEGCGRKLSDFVVIVVPIETDPNEAAYSLQRMHADWFHLPGESQKTKSLANRFGVWTVPRLIVCKSNGETLSLKARGELEARHSAAISTWIEMSYAKPKPLVHGFDLDGDGDGVEGSR